MYKKILVPLDGSPLSEKILAPIEVLARAIEAKVILLQVEENPILLGYDEVIAESTYHQQKQIRMQMESYLTSIEKRFQKKGIEAEHFIRFGPVVGSLLSIAEKDDVDLIALASHGLDDSYPGMRRSVAARLLQRSKCPILVMRKNNGGAI